MKFGTKKAGFTHQININLVTNHNPPAEVRPIRLIRSYQIPLLMPAGCIIFSHIFIMNARLN